MRNVPRRSRPCARCVVVALVASLAFACETAEEAFVGDRIGVLCDDSYWICNVPTGCVLDQKHYVEGSFPGVRRVVVETDEPERDVQARLFFSAQEAPGTELLAQLYEPSCILDTTRGRSHLQDVDVFDRAGDDRMLVFDFEALEPGEHLLEIYSDASAGYLLVIELE